MNWTAAYEELASKLEGWLDTVILMLPNLALAVVVVVIAGFAGRFVSRGLERVLKRTDSSPSAIGLFTRIARYGILLVGLLLALTILELDGAVTSLLAGAGVVGLALGFAFQDLASNFISGVGLSLRRPLQVGDLLEHGDTFGVVEDIDLRTTSVRLPTGPLVLIPNKQIYQEKVRIFTDLKTRRVDLEVGVSYGEDLERVLDITRGAIESVEALRDDRPVQVFFTGFGGSSIDLVARFWIPFEKQSEFMSARSDAVIAVKKAYDANDIVIPFPIRTLDFGIKGGATLNEMIPDELVEAA